MPTAPRLEHVYYDPPTPVPAEPWWTRYAAQLVTLSQTARLALEADCRFILERGVLQADAQDRPVAVKPRPHRPGHGFVQSGNGLHAGVAPCPSTTESTCRRARRYRLSLCQTYERLVRN
jgi:hypothetical protein